MGYLPKQYDSAKDFLGGTDQLGNIIDPMDSMRLSVYNLYEDFYANRPETFRVTMSDSSDIEIYLPSTKKIVDATARFLAIDFDFQLKGGNASEAEVLLRKIWKREEISKRFIKGKKSLLTRGDQMWHITADPNKRSGERISINSIHPSSYFPIEDPNNTNRVIGCHLVDLVKDPRENDPNTKKLVARRQTYMKEPNGQISSWAGTFEIGGWDDRNLTPDKLKPVSIIWEKRYLPKAITALPVYHLPNNEPDGSTWGLSQVAGIEYIINAMNQSVTYEDLTLVLQGLGVYTSTAGPPKDNATGAPKTYKLGPGDVVELSQGDEFKRVTGVSSITPFQDHLEFLDAWSLQGSGIPEMATGTVDVSVAQSGIALALKMGPIIAENADKQLAIGGKWDQIGYDLIHGWLPAFEGIDSEATEFTSTFGDPMPLDRDAYVKELIELYSSGLLLIDEVREKLEKIGYKYSSDLTDKLLEEASKKATAEQGEPETDELGADAPDLMSTLERGSSSMRLVN